MKVLGQLLPLSYFLTDFRQINKRIMSKPLPIPKINQILYKIEGMQWVSVTYLKMRYHNIRLDPDAKKNFTLTIPSDKYKYLPLPRGIS